MIATQIKRELDAKRAAAKDAYQRFAKRRDEGLKEGIDWVTDTAAFNELHELNRSWSTIADEVDALEKQFTSALEMEGKGDDRGDHRAGDVERRAAASGIWTPGLRVTQNETYKKMAEAGDLTKKAGVQLPNIEVLNRDEAVAMLKHGRGLLSSKALITGSIDTSGGAFVETDRQGYYGGLLRPLMVRNLVTVGQTDSDLVEWVKENSFTNAAAEVAEATATTGANYDAGLKPESSLDFQIIQSAVRTIAHWIPATKRALADAGQLRTIIDQRLEDGVELRLDAQMIAGNGTGENLRGILNTTGIASVARNVAGNEPAVEAILRGITAVRLAFMEPTSVLLHPNDYVGIRLVRDTNGNYTMGPPNLPGPEQLWGVPIVQSTAMPENTGLVGKFDEAILWVREGVTVSATDSHADFFTHNLVAILAEGRFAFGVPRPAGFAAVTSI